MKKTLKQIRQDLGVNAGEAAQRINAHASQYSLYENGQALPPLEDMVLLEREFSQRIDWKDEVDEADKAEIVNHIARLAEHYPLSTVLLFVQRSLKADLKVNKPTRTIGHWTSVANKNNIEDLLLPPDIEG